MGRYSVFIWNSQPVLKIIHTLMPNTLAKIVLRSPRREREYFYFLATHMRTYKTLIFVWWRYFIVSGRRLVFSFRDGYARSSVGHWHKPFV